MNKILVTILGLIFSVSLGLSQTFVNSRIIDKTNLSKRIAVKQSLNPAKDAITNCPSESLFSNPYDAPNYAETSEQNADGVEYLVATSFQTVGGSIETISIWMMQMYFDLGWQLCNNATKNVSVKFYSNNNGIPGTVLKSFENITANLIPANIVLYNSNPVWILNIDLPTVVDINSGFVSIQGLSPVSGDNCWLMWINAPHSSGLAFQYEDESGWMPTEAPLTLCLGGTPSECPAPMNFYVAQANTNNIKLDWHQVGEVSEWNIEYGLQGFIPTGTPSINNIQTHPYEIGGLNGATYYDFYIQSSCGSYWLGPLSSHTTNCDVADVCTYTFNMNDEFGDGWTGCGIAVYENDLLIDVISLVNAGTGTKTIQLCNEANIVLKFIAGDYPEDMAFTMIDAWGETVVSYNYGYFTNFANGAIINSFVADCVPPECPSPNNLLINQTTSTSASLSWTETGSADNWIIEYGLFGFELGSGTQINSTSNYVQINNLAPSNYYQFYVKSVCNENSISNWSNPKIFSTQCAVTEVLHEGFEVNVPPACWKTFANGTGVNKWTQTSFYSNSGSFSAVALREYSGGENQKWLVTGKMQVPENHNLSFFVRDYYTPNYNSIFKVLISTNDNPNNTNAYTELLQLAETDITNLSFTKINLNLSNYVGQTVYIAFVVIDSDGDDWFIDDVKFEYDESTFVGTINNNLLQIYPNPSNGIVNISNAKECFVDIFSVLGYKLCSVYIDEDEAQLNLSNLDNGSYIIKLRKNSHIEFKNMILLKE